LGRRVAVAETLKLFTNGRSCALPGAHVVPSMRPVGALTCRDSCASTLSDYRGSDAASPDVGVVQPVKARYSPSRSPRWPWTSAP
jgi:hypothetical protein